MFFNESKKHGRKTETKGKKIENKSIKMIYFGGPILESKW